MICQRSFCFDKTRNKRLYSGLAGQDGVIKRTGNIIKDGQV
jgi:hypothetical protein